MAKANGKRKQAYKQDEPDERALVAASVLLEMEGGKSLRGACEAVGVAPTTFLLWAESDSALAEQYARARARLLEVKADELEEIGERAVNAETAVEVAGLRLLSDNRKWLLSKLAPKKYGEKLAIGGAEDLPPVRTESIDLKGLSADELATMKQLLAKGKAALGEGQLG